METKKQLNFDLYKSESEYYRKLTNKIVQALSTETLVKELKRRKVIKYDYLDEEFKLK